VLALVVAHRDLLGVVEQDVGRLQRRIGEQPAGHEVGLVGLLLELDHAPQLAERGRALHDPAQLGVLVHLALGEQRAHLGVEPGGHQDLGDLERLGPQHGRVLGDGERVQVDDAVDGGVVVLRHHPAPDRTQVVAEVDVAGRLDAGEHAGHAAILGAIRRPAEPDCDQRVRAATRAPPGRAHDERHGCD
jgi:hypothetical protein